ncbi:MAG: peptide deformylase [Planctomycetota bacterium]|nr:peptide deformylase [Planctomycetota bacterium]
MPHVDPEPLDVLVYPHPSLRKPARAITPDEVKAGRADGWDLAELVARMTVTLYANKGIGLAATQVGVGLRLFLVDISKDEDGLMAIANPVLTDMRGSVVEEEGCLSVPEIRAKVKRYAELTLTGVSVKGGPISFEAEELLARACQHEVDHLDGILFINRLGIAGRLMVRKQLAQLEDDYRRLQARKLRAHAVPAAR